ncbi:SMI1/KNR4 family protein [Streptomyces sp. NPDC059402]|uniref:SMI1/KNR4 family protein n=1 Tax=Streptomyces sp. NPDC059402 TaxID=3346822 RepID=UPI0036B154B2
MTARDDLVRTVPPPPDVDIRVDWPQVEHDLGVSLPDDYKWLVERYGPGSFDSFLHVFQPVAPVATIRLVDRAERAAEILDQLREGGEAIPHPTDELLAVGATDKGDTIYWVTRPGDAPNSWTITANGARNTKWPHFDGGLVEFLAAVMSGEYKVDVLPRSWPGPDPLFTPYPSSGECRR